VPLVLPLVLLAGLASPSRADRFSIGASLGASEGEGGTDSVSYRSVFARLRIVGGLSIEGELGGTALEHEAAGGASDCLDCNIARPGVRARGKLAAATVRFDLSNRGTLRPHLLAGAGVENWSSQYIDFVYGRREIGVGLDVRLTEGLHLGADVRTGERELIATRQTRDVALLVYVPPPLTEESTGYVAGRLTLTATF
jgi:hypothetical protein